MKVKCAICGKECNLINFLHLRVHGLTTAEYRALYPDAPLCSDELKEVRSDQMLNSNPMNVPEYREKISVANKNPPEETRRKMSENNAMHNPEHRKKVSVALTGKKFSDEHKKNISKAKEGSWVGNKNPMKNPKYIKKSVETRRQRRKKRQRDKILGKYIKIIDYSGVHSEKRRVICLFCGRYYNYLGKHLRSKHNITTKEYLKQFPDASLGVNPMQRPEIAAKHKVPKSEEHKKKISVSLTGKKHTEEHRKHSQAAIKVAMQNFRGENNPMSRPEVKQKHQEAVNTDSYRKIIGERSRENWEDPEFVKRWMKSNNTRPNKPETRLNSILQALVPGEYEYNGGFECGISLGRKIPDFVNVNGKKKVIELYGDYWHEGEDPEDRIALFKRYGYETLVIWEHELNDSLKLTARILKFEDLPCDKIPRQLSIFDS